MKKDKTIRDAFGENPQLSNNQGVSRRAFVGGAATAATIVAASLMTGSIVGCTPDSKTGDKVTTGGSAAIDGNGSAFTSSNPDWELPAFSEVADEAIDTEIVIVGGGMGGMAAALTAAEGGAKVVLVEKNGSLGAGTSFAEGIFAVESPLQEELGIKANVRQMLQLEYAFQRYIVNSTLWNVVATNSPTDIRWLMDQGVEFSELGGGSTIAEMRTQHMYLEHRGANALAVMEEKALNLGIEIRKSTRATHILKDGDKIVGIQAISDGSVLNINAKAVIMASGGVGGNRDLINAYTNRNADNMYWCGGPNVTGDGIMMVSEAGMGKPYRISAPGLGMTVEPLGVSSELAAAGAMEPTNLWVNQDAVRFTNEALTRTYIYALNACDSQLKTFSVFDQTSFDRFMNEGCKMGWGFYVNKGTKLTQLQKELDRELSGKNPFVFTADTLEELARKMGIDPTTFKATVDEYNGIVAAQEDPLFGKDPAFLVEVKTPPFYGFRIKSSVVQWLGGIHINRNGEVITTDGTVLPGLYAAGIDCAGFQGETYGLTIPGSCQGIALGMGRQSARSAVAYVKS